MECCYWNRPVGARPCCGARVARARPLDLPALRQIPHLDACRAPGGRELLVHVQAESPEDLHKRLHAAPFEPACGERHLVLRVVRYLSSIVSLLNVVLLGQF